MNWSSIFSNWFPVQIISCIDRYENSIQVFFWFLPNFTLVKRAFSWKFSPHYRQKKYPYTYFSYFERHFHALKRLPYIALSFMNLKISKDHVYVGSFLCPSKNFPLYKWKRYYISDFLSTKNIVSYIADHAYFFHSVSFWYIFVEFFIMLSSCQLWFPFTKTFSPA